ncbi:succinate dehydrogenase, cytochrome b556 subunit [Massilia forsythiae]|uniref:Succinate dehydrogenase cytochrome b556 subunit n=1 Tax=Massilia forsythiae TaxID=2728020 RepID=A0A7Z2VXV3_9BURK|nr:succinate dehydrogenase, cytochrome b556 subunit [Massilia forsythiae]QJE01219.1 succinate dehydrogenase, cytochrome b556 subunit [Massilia forsythiae]
MSEAIRNQQKRGQPLRNIGIKDITVNYKQPPSAIVSIMHRISGFLLFLSLPFLLYLFQESLRSEISFAHFAGVVGHPLIKIVILALSWAYLHHFVAGLRHLVMDNHIALDREASQKTARWVLMIVVALTVLVALKLFGVF